MSAKNTISEFNTSIEKGAMLSQDQLSEFNCYFKSFNSMEKQFVEYRSYAEDIITVTKKALSTRLLELENDTKKYYDAEQINLHKLANNLSTIQQMSENMTLFEDQINKTLDKIFADYSEKRIKDAKAAIDLQ